MYDTTSVQRAALPVGYESTSLVSVDLSLASKL